jgi:hypothetical protein
MIRPKKRHNLKRCLYGFLLGDFPLFSQDKRPKHIAPSDKTFARFRRNWMNSRSRLAESEIPSPQSVTASPTPQDENHREQRTHLRGAFFLVITALLFAVAPLIAQIVYGSLVGTVTDTSGAVVSGATVTLSNLGTSERRTTQTDVNGGYQFLTLVPGHYEVDVEKPGFKRFSRQPVDVQVQTATRIDAALPVGDVQQTVNVAGESPLLQTQNASLGTTVEGRSVQEMPLNGRNIMSLVALVPGVVPQGASQSSVLNNQSAIGNTTNPAGWNNYQIGGAIAGASGEYLDGAATNIIGNNPGWVAFVPTQDAIQEFKVETNNVDPAFGRFGGGVVNFSTKTGTNDFHGSAYEFFRNTVLNANNFFLNRSGIPRSQLNQNQYGVVVGGPIRKNKVFFFFSWEGYQERAGLPYSGFVPTAAQLSGNFAGLPTITDPQTGQPFPGNVIPQSRFDPTANILANQVRLWPAPNASQPGVNYVANALSGGSSNQYNARFDWNISDKQRLFARYTDWPNSTLATDYFFIGSTGKLPGVDGHSRQLVLGDAYTFNPTTIADIRLAVTRFHFDVKPASLGVDLSTLGPNWAVIGPQLRYTAYPWMTFAAYSAAPYSALLELTTSSDYAISGALTKIIGRHTLRFGGEARLLLQTSNNSLYGAGNFNFIGSPTGDAVASFLLGIPVGGTSSQISVYNVPYLFNRYQGYYVADNFQFNPHLTFNLGLRWELPGSEGEKHNNDTVFLPDATDPLSGITGLNLTGQLGLVNSPQYGSRYETKLHYDLFAPRVGFAWQVRNNTVLRGGYGITYLPLENWIGYGPETSPINAATTYLGTNGTLSNPFPNGLNHPTGRAPDFMTALEGGSLSSTLPNQAYPYAQQWNLDLQQEFWRGTLFDLAYGGAKGTHLSNPFDLNQISDQYNALGPQLLTPLPTNPFAGQVPVTSFLNSSFTTGQSLRPYPQFSSITISNYSGFGTNYNSLQAALQKRFSAGGTLLISYTWAKTMGNADTLQGYLETNPVGGVQNYNNLRAERSLMSFDVTHRFVASYVYDLPFGHGQHWFGEVTGVTDKLVSGWALNGITTFQSGFPLVMTYALPTVLSQYFGAGTPRPNVAPDCDKQIQGSGTSKLNEWFNTSCFSAPSPYGYGNESRTDPKLRGQGIDNWDLALSKTTKITERFALEFRGEFFNTFNRVQFAPPGTSYNPDTLGTSANSFGVVTAQNNLPRQIQFALRLRY